MTTSTGTAKVTLPSDEEILITREFDAPKHLVYRAFTTPELVKRWWAGQRGEVTLAEIDLQVGGRWRYAMITREGGFEVAFHGEYRELVPDELIVSTETFEGVPQLDLPGGGTTLNTATFAEVEGRTTLTINVRCEDKQTRDAIIDSGMEGGMQEGMDLLEQIAVSLAEA